ncbi:MAG TPA: TonB family protein [Candidatus Polarisedimenticolaceae bacterium]|nr:TonB family protein [Candidatus Polarisedimenticolaceae bacterium]
MSEQDQSFRLDDKLAAEDRLYDEMFHSRDRGIIWKALAAAIVIHVAVLIINFPTFKRAIVPQRAENVIIVKKYVPPPPKVERRQVVKKQLTKKVPIPDPTPDEPEPIREPEPEIEPEPVPPDVEFLIGVPEPPPESGPLIAGAGDVTNPELIAESKLEPEYPELARVARLEGNVILQAIIKSDGTVGDVEVLRTNRPGMGFEDAAIKAVRQWRYKPALQNGKPVEVYFTVFVDFKLH